MNSVFSLGSKWIYFKIYSGYKTADIVLLEYLNEKIEMLLSENVIEKWFFIRYNDSDSHLRIRFQVNKTEHVFRVIEELHPIFEDLLQKNFIWKVQSDTYLREIERYGVNKMEESETFFYVDSEMIMKYLALKKDFDNEETQLLFSFLSIDSFLNAFKISTSEKLQLLDGMQQSFKKEFSATKVLKSELDKHYRTLEKEISNVMTDSSNELYQIVVNKFNAIDAIADTIKENLEINLNSFLSSHIHMMINRQYTSRQREYETLIYDHLYRYYKTCFYRNSHSLKVNATQNLLTLR